MKFFSFSVYYHTHFTKFNIYNFDQKSLYFLNIYIDNFSMLLFTLKNRLNFNYLLFLQSKIYLVQKNRRKK